MKKIPILKLKYQIRERNRKRLTYIFKRFYKCKNANDESVGIGLLWLRVL